MANSNSKITQIKLTNTSYDIDVASSLKDTSPQANSTNVITSGALYNEQEARIATDALKLDKKPDGTNDLLDENNKINSHYISDTISGNHTHTISAGATDGIFNITGTAGTNKVTYSVEPYTSRQTTAGKFDTSDTDPSGTTRLNWDGYLYATKLYSGGTEVSVRGHSHSYAGSDTAGGPATRVKSTAITSSDGVLNLISNGAGATAFDITATNGITPITGGPTLGRYAQGIVTSDSIHEGTLLAVNSSGTPYCGFISNNNGTATWSSLKQILTVGDEQYARYKSATVGTEGWYRIYTSDDEAGSGKDHILVTLGHSFNDNQTEDYSFMISVGYFGDIQITQLSGVSSGGTITKLRVVTKNSEVAFIDFYKITDSVNTYYVGGIGAGTFCAPTSCTGDMAADEPTGYYTKTVTVGASFRVNGSLYAGGTAVTLNGSSKAGATASLYAPTTGGTSGYICVGAGTTSAPTWVQTLPIANGGTGATTADAARKNLGAAAASHTHNYAGSSSAGGSATSANKLATARTIALSGDVSGSTTFDGSGNVTITANIPSLDASKITSGTLSTSRIPGLAASKITAGTFSIERGGTGATTAADARANLRTATLYTETDISTTSPAFPSVSAYGATFSSKSIVNTTEKNNNYMLHVSSLGRLYAGYQINQMTTPIWNEVSLVGHATHPSISWGNKVFKELNSKGWYRVYQGANSNTEGDTVLINISSGYQHARTITLSFVITLGYLNDANIKLLSCTGQDGSCISNIRVVKDPTVYGKSYIDIYFNKTNPEYIYVTGIGQGTFQAPEAAPPLTSSQDVIELEISNHHTLGSNTGYVLTTTSGTVGISQGGTGATTADAARNNLGAAAKSHTHSNYALVDHTHSNYAKLSHPHSASAITSGTLDIARGGTGATTADAARNNLGAAPISHAHTTLVGTYTGTNQGMVAPSYVGANAVKCNMMHGFLNTSGGILTDFDYYADVLMMDAYHGSDVPYVTALAINKGSRYPRAWIANGDYGNTTGWNAAAELWTNANLNFSLSETGVLSITTTI